MQLVLTASPYEVYQRKEAKHSAYDKLSVSDMQDAIELVTDLVLPGWPCSCVLHCAAACNTT